MKLKSTLTFVFALLSFGAFCQIGPPPTGPVEPVDPDPTFPTVEEPDPIEKIDGNLSVSLSGAAVYELPIKVPKGVNEMEPKISLQYNSQSPSGIAGVGWNISGGSSITRIPSTLHHDGKISAVDFSKNDRFALDGQRLILKSGSYGGDGAEYQTENYSNVKITSHGVSTFGASYGPKYFKVVYPNGNVAMYGETDNSRSRMEYALSYTKDTSNNIIVYNYEEKGGLLLLSSIKYVSRIASVIAVPDLVSRPSEEVKPVLTSGESSSNFELPKFRLYENEIRFLYAAWQTRTEQYYVGGIQFESKHRLHSVEVYSGDSMVRYYELTNKQDALGYSYVNKITEYNGVDNKPLPAITFNYDADFSTHRSFEKSANFSQSTLSNLTGDRTAKNYSIITGQFDQDGMVDYILYNKFQSEIWLYHTTAANKGQYIYKNDGGGGVKAMFTVQLKDANNVVLPYESWVEVRGTTLKFKSFSNGVIKDEFSRTYNFPKFKQNPHPTNCNSSYLEFSYTRDYYSGDFDGDGLTDIITVQNPATFRIPRCSTTPPFRILEPFEMSFAGGSIDLLDYMQDSSEPISKGFISDYQNDTKIVTGNFTGSSKTELLVINHGNLAVYSYDGANFTRVINYTNDFIKTSLQAHLGDFNGDGKTDVMFSSENQGTKIFSSTGLSFEITDVPAFSFYDKGMEGSFTNEYYGEYDTYMAADFNRDGKTDIMRFKYLVRDKDYGARKKGGQVRSVTFFKNTGNGFEELLTTVKSGTISDSNHVKITSTDNAIQYVPIPFYIGFEYNSVYTNNDYKMGLFINDRIETFAYKYNHTERKQLKSIDYGNDIMHYLGYLEYGVYNTKYDDRVTFYDLKPYMKYSTNTLAYPYMEPALLPDNWMVAYIRLLKGSDNLLKKSFSYASPVFDAKGLGFLGFKGIVSTNWYDKVDNMYKNIREFDVTQRGALKKESTITGNQWNAFIETNSGGSGGLEGEFFRRNYEDITTYEYNSQILPNKVFKIQNTKIKKMTYGGLMVLAPFFVETTREYNSYNDVIKQTTQYGLESMRVNAFPTIAKTEVTENTYAYAPTATNYHMGLLTKRKTTQKALNEVAYVSEEKFTFDNKNRVIESNKKDNNGIAIVENREYDTFGNMITKRVSAGNLMQEEKYKYDSYGRFKIEETDIAGLTTKYTYNKKRGTLIEMTSPYGLKTKYGYNHWGQQTTLTDYLGKVTKTAYTKNGSTAEVTTTNDEGGWKKEYFDVWQNKVKVSTKNIKGDLVHQSFVYDRYNRIVKESEPYFGDTPSLWKTTEYDKKGRISKVTNSKGKVTTTTYGVSKITINDDGRIKETVLDAAGDIVSKKDEGGEIEYKYFSNGTLKSVNYNGIVTALEQDAWGRKTKLTDPSAGVFTYEYDALGRLIKETTPKGSTQFTVNTFGKVTKKKITGDQTNSEVDYSYDSTTQLLKQSVAVINGKNYVYDYHYDDYQRVKETVETAPTASFTTSITFDEFGREKQKTLKATAYGKTNETQITNTYKNGYHWQIADGATHQILVSKENTSERGLLTEIKLGNQIQINNVYDRYGHLTTNTVKINAVELFKLTNIFGVQRSDLVSRTNGLFANYRETFTYDALNRLTSFTNKSGIQETQVYDDRGRIESNALGTYEYNDTNSYQLGAVDLQDDAKAYYQLRPEQQVLYNAFKSPVWIKEQGKENIYFDYNANNARSTMYYGNEAEDPTQSKMIRHYAANGLMEVTYDVTDNKVDFVTYIDGDAYAANVIAKGETTTTSQFYYLHRDYLGSILAISNSRGLLVEKRHFDAWGNLVFVKDGQNNTLDKLTFFDRGYTGHEHLQGAALVHMNGRLYDPVVRRFLAPDNFVQDPGNTQNFNRYSYVLNNPLAYVDESGEFLGFIFTSRFDFLRNFAKHGVNFKYYDWSRTKNAWEIDKGLFTGNFFQIVNKWTWGALNTAVGNFVGHGMNAVGGVYEVSHLDGAVALSTKFVSGEEAFTLGNYIMGPEGFKADWTDHLFVHEYGHYIQSSYFGSLYLPIVGTTSITSAAKLGGDNHRTRWFEVHASRLGGKYFDKRYGSGKKGYVDESADYFNYDVFKNGGETKYKNLRTDSYKQKEHPTTGASVKFWDFAVPVLSFVVVNHILTPSSIPIPLL